MDKNIKKKDSDPIDPKKLDKVIYDVYMEYQKEIGNVDNKFVK